MSSAVSSPRPSSRRALGLGVTALAVVGALSACSPAASDAPSNEITYRVLVTGGGQKQISAVAYYTSPSEGKDSVRADAGTVMLKKIEGKDQSVWETTARVTEGQRIELTAAPATSADTVSCVVLKDGNAFLNETAEAGKPVTCTNQPDNPARR